MYTDDDDLGSTQRELARLRSKTGVAELFSEHREQLERMVHFRLDRRLYGRVDASDILQEAYLDVSRRIDEYLSEPTVSFFVWARQITWQRLLMTHRLQLGVQKRDASLEIPLHGLGNAGDTSVSLAEMLVGSLTSPSEVAIRDERAEQLRAALDTMDPIDREVLALRHFEHLSNADVAQVLSIQPTAASNRYVRALERLREILSDSMLP
jgi:RNA polymerase sigma-70 factor, ECF subfamily